MRHDFINLFGRTNSATGSTYIPPLPTIFPPDFLTGHAPPPRPISPFSLPNLNPGLLTQPGLNRAAVPYNWSVQLPTPKVYRSPETTFPNLLVTTLTFVQEEPKLVPHDFFRHPPSPKPGEVFAAQQDWLPIRTFLTPPYDYNSYLVTHGHPPLPPPPEVFMAPAGHLLRVLNQFALPLRSGDNMNFLFQRAPTPPHPVEPFIGGTITGSGATLEEIVGLG